jgi:hypothetical protein
MDERLRFIARLLEGEKMSPLCREFGISRVTGYKIYERYKTCGLDGLNVRILLTGYMSLHHVAPGAGRLCLGRGLIDISVLAGGTENAA